MICFSDTDLLLFFSIYGANYNYPGPAVQWVPVVGQAAKGFCTLGYKNPLVCYDFVGNQKVVNSATPAGIPEGEGKVVGSKYYIPSYSFGKISWWEHSAAYHSFLESVFETLSFRSVYKQLRHDNEWRVCRVPESGRQRQLHNQCEKPHLLFDNVGRR